NAANRLQHALPHFIENLDWKLCETLALTHGDEQFHRQRNRREDIQHRKERGIDESARVHASVRATLAGVEQAFCIDRLLDRSHHIDAIFTKLADEPILLA